MHADAATVLAEHSIKVKFEPLGVDVQSSTPEAFAARMRAESELWGPIINIIAARKPTESILRCGPAKPLRALLTLAC
jgi:hypothetical protein